MCARSAWRDFTLTDGPAVGQHPEQLHARRRSVKPATAPMGASAASALLDANVYGTVAVGGLPLFAKVGNQLLPWGVPATIAGGLCALNPINKPAARRPGALPEEIGIPFPAVFARLGLTSTINVEAFYQFAFQRTEPLGCGTFFSSCRLHRRPLRQGHVRRRAQRPQLDRHGQLREARAGSAIRLERRPVRRRRHLQNGIDRAPSSAPTSRSITAATGIIGVIKSRAPRNSVHRRRSRRPQSEILRASIPSASACSRSTLITRQPDMTLFAEVVHRPNQPLQLNGTDLTNAAISNTAATLVRAEYSAVPLGGILSRLRSLATTDILLGGSQTFGGILGAKTLTLGGEVGLKYVHDLPDVNVRRYGRSDVFGSVPFNGVCSTVAPRPVLLQRRLRQPDRLWRARPRRAELCRCSSPTPTSRRRSPTATTCAAGRTTASSTKAASSRCQPAVGIPEALHRRDRLPADLGRQLQQRRDRDVMTLAVSADFDSGERAVGRHELIPGSRSGSCRRRRGTPR